MKEKPSKMVVFPRRRDQPGISIQFRRPSIAPSGHIVFTRIQCRRLMTTGTTARPGIRGPDQEKHGKPAGTILPGQVRSGQTSPGQATSLCSERFQNLHLDRLPHFYFLSPCVLRRQAACSSFRSAIVKQSSFISQRLSNADPWLHHQG